MLEPNTTSPRRSLLAGLSGARTTTPAKSLPFLNRNECQGQQESQPACYSTSWVERAALHPRIRWLAKTKVRTLPVNGVQTYRQYLNEGLIASRRPRYVMALFEFVGLALCIEAEYVLFGSAQRDDIMRGPRRSTGAVRRLFGGELGSEG